MDSKISVNSSGKRVKGAKADEQERHLAAIEAKRDADRKAAAEADAARQAADKAAAEAERAAEERAAAEAEEQRQKAAEAKREAVEQLGAAALSAGTAAIGAAAKSAEKGELKVSKNAVIAIAVVVVAIAFLLFVSWPVISATMFPKPQTHVATELSEQSTMRNTSAEVSQAILGEARQKRELVVWEQDVQVDSEISQAFANIPLFEKTKVVHCFGTGVFTVNMGQITAESIDVDDAAHAVTMSIPHAQLQYVTKDLEKTEFEDTRHAILGFGDVQMTQEQQNLLEQSIDKAMRAELETDECFADADKAALLEVYDVYQPLIAKVDAAYTLEVKFAE